MKRRVPLMPRNSGIQSKRRSQNGFRSRNNENYSYSHVVGPLSRAAGLVNIPVWDTIHKSWILLQNITPEKACFSRQHVGYHSIQDVTLYALSEQLNSLGFSLGSVDQSQTSLTRSAKGMSSPINQSETVAPSISDNVGPVLGHFECVGGYSVINAQESETAKPVEHPGSCARAKTFGTKISTLAGVRATWMRASLRTKSAHFFHASSRAQSKGATCACSFIVFWSVLSSYLVFACSIVRFSGANRMLGCVFIVPTWAYP